MRYARFLCLLVLLSVAAVSAAADIQVLCEPGLRVFLDGELVGTSSAREDGIFLEGVPRGTHTVRVEKHGFVSQSFQVEVSDLPIEIKVEELTPESVAPAKSEAPEAEVLEPLGSMVVTSAPQNCTVEIDGRTEEKSTPQLTIGGLAAGEHTISFSKPGYAPISGVVSVQPESDLAVRGNLMDGRVEVSHLGMGSLRVMSKPTRCTVRLLGKVREKTNLILNLTHLPAGEHPIVVSMPGRQLATKVWIMDGQRTILEVSFMKGDEPFLISHVPE